jgi:hypothetical protein
MGCGLAAYGLEVGAGRTEELAQGIRAEQPAIREALIAALDDWKECAETARKMDAVTQPPELANVLAAIATAADDDLWRTRYRAAATAGDVPALRALSGQARRLPVPPSSLVLLAGSLKSLGARDEALALGARPSLRGLLDPF